MYRGVKMDWTAILKRRFSDLTADELTQYHRQLASTNVDDIPSELHRNYLELVRFILNHEEAKRKLTVDRDGDMEIQRTRSRGKVDLTTKGDIDESYYIQTIQDLNREIAEINYNRGNGNGDIDLLHPMGIETKKSLLSKIHTKNQYIRRLLCENESLRQQIDKLNEKNLQLDICLKQTTNQLTKANSDIVELRRQNSLNADETMLLNQKLEEFSKQMQSLEKEKLKYQTDLLCLGQEIHRRVNKWNDVFRKKRDRFPQLVNEIAAQQVIEQSQSTIYNESKRHDEIKIAEINILSQAVVKRNALISELESLLTSLTLEIAHSAEVINNLTQNFSIRENNFTENIEKLQEHLYSILHKQKLLPQESDAKTSKAKPIDSTTSNDMKSIPVTSSTDRPSAKLKPQKKRKENIL